MWFIWFDFSKKKDENSEDYSWIFWYLLIMAFVIMVGGGLVWWIINSLIALF